MKNTLKRICIYPKDVQRITGKSYRQSIRIVSQIKQQLNKDKNHLVTIEEFCNHTGINEESVNQFI
ncbi:MAG: hypothetical protein KGZ87_05280 [Bacteroidetes bacterium]|nr:hypothetical protein [Bacteroidota bacterium]